MESPPTTKITLFAFYSSSSSPFRSESHAPNLSLSLSLSLSPLLLSISQDTCFGALRRELDHSQSEILEVHGDSSLLLFARVFDS